jgi:hypothetical protein
VYSVQRLLEKVGLSLLDHQHRPLVGTERDQLVVDQRVGDVHNVERQWRGALRVGQAEQLQRADH